MNDENLKSNRTYSGGDNQGKPSSSNEKVKIRNTVQETKPPKEEKKIK